MKEALLTCKELTELITDYLEERLPHADRIRFEEHITACSGCLTYLDQMRLTIKTLGAKPPLAIPKEVESELLKTFRRWKEAGE